MSKFELRGAAAIVTGGSRGIGPYIAEAKLALADHIVADADLVDAGAIFGTGFAPFRGGPLHYASHDVIASRVIDGEPALAK